MSEEKRKIEFDANISSATTPERERLMDFLQSTIGSQFVIPIFQRDYKWETKGKKQHSVVDFMNDFENIVEGKYKKHFLGILIYVAHTTGTDSREFSIIDGQQRLVTFYLTLFALKKIMEDKGEDNSKINNFARQYFYSNPYVSNEKELVLKLKPQVSDDNVYEKIATGKFGKLSKEDKKTRVYLAYDYICNRMLNIVDKYDTDYIINCLKQFYIVIVPVSPNDYPQKIFESINVAGAKLSKADAIRNFVLMPIDEKHQTDFYKDYWAKIEKYVSKDSEKIENFFRFFLSAKNRRTIDKDALFEEFVAWFNIQEKNYSEQDENLSKPDITGKILEIVVTYAKYYEIICSEEISSIKKELRSSLSEFRNCGKQPSDMPFPLFMELYHMAELTEEGTNSEISLTFKQLSQIISFTTIYLMRRWLCDVNTNSITTLFTSILNHLVNDMKENPEYDIVELYKKYLVNENKGQSSEMPTPKALKNKISTSNLYADQVYLMAFFKKYENFDRQFPVAFPDKTSIEHLMPETPTPLWLQESEAVDMADYQEHLHQIGNLSLGTPKYQAEASNHIWEYKNKVIRETVDLKLNKDLPKDHWTVKDIENRTNDLIGKIEEMYPYFESSLKPNEVYIYMKTNDVYARGTYFIKEDYFKVDRESVLLGSGPSGVKWIDDMRNSFKSNKVIGISHGKLIFKKSYDIPSSSEKSSINIITSLILNENIDNGSDYWKTVSDDISLTEFLK